MAKTPTVEQMRQFIMAHMAKAKMMHKADGGAIDIATVGINEAPDMDVKEAVMPNATYDNAMPTGGVDFQPQAPGMQLAQQAPAPQPGQAPGTPGMPQVGQSAGMPGQNMPTMPAPQGQSPVAAGAPPSNILSRTPQGNMLQAMKPMARMADGGSTTTAQMKQELDKFLEHSKEKRRMYHGTGKSFNTFAPNTRGVHFVTPDPKFADKYAGGEYSVEVGESPNIMPVHVSVSNPFDFENKKHVNDLATKASLGKIAIDQIKKGHWPRIEDRTTLQAIKDMGHDAVYVKENGVKNLGVFDPNKIKSATGNRGTYDTSKADITMKTGGKVKGVIKEKVKVSPTGDAMMYELTRAQRYTKKVK